MSKFFILYIESKNNLTKHEDPKSINSKYGKQDFIIKTERDTLKKRTSLCIRTIFTTRSETQTRSEIRIESGTGKTYWTRETR